MERFVQRMKLHRVRCSVVYQCALFQRHLAKKGVPAELVQGFVCLGGGCCRHYWVEDQSGTKFDVGSAMGSVKIPVELSPEPVGTRFDQDEESQKLVLENEAHYELFQKDPRRFWAECPVRNFVC